MSDEDALKLFLGAGLKNPQDASLSPRQDLRLMEVNKVTEQEILLKLEGLLNKSLPRHDGTPCLCLHGGSRFRVIEAYQVTNRDLWRRYERHVQGIYDKHEKHRILPQKINPPVGEALTEFAEEIDVNLLGNERLLFHGTRSFEIAQKIAAEGFDPRIAHSNGLYGRGTYFASQTCKSAQYAIEDGHHSKATPSKMGTMLIARVAIGDPFYTPKGCPDISSAFDGNSFV